MVLICATQAMSWAARHCGKIFIPPVSPSTRLPPERWLWSIGVTVISLFFLLPSFVMIGDIMMRSARLQGRFAMILLFVALAGLMGEAWIPLQEDILNATPDQVNVQSMVHLSCAAVFFMGAIAHGAYVVHWQACRSSPSARVFSNSSLYVKGGVLSLVVLTFLGVIPLALLALCPATTCPPEERMANLGGLSQRCLIVCICLFIATYALDIRNAQRSVGGAWGLAPLADGVRLTCTAVLKDNLATCALWHLYRGLATSTASAR